MMLLARLYRDRLDGEPNLYEAWLAAAREARPVVRRHRRKLAPADRAARSRRAGRPQLFQARSNERLILFLTDALFRFTDPNAIAADRSLERKELERRMARVLSATVRAMAVRVV